MPEQLAFLDPLPRDGVKRSAVIVGAYRYELCREWPVPRGEAQRTVLWVMLNPSTADGTDDDRTLSKIMGYTRRWGFDSLCVVNLYAYRATEPRDMIAAAKRGVDIIGNDDWIDGAIARADLVVCGWGRNVEDIPGGRARAADILRTIHRFKQPHALKMTKGGHPQHPLYLPGDLVPEPMPEVARG